uniref:Uncharacterized protein n=1 Tax=Bracon brevicornis TaxID=1563983 RepID=A0A6V7KT08_9HYME
MSEPNRDKKSTDRSIVNYFENNAPTVFDEIVSKLNEEVGTADTIPNRLIDNIELSTAILQKDNLFEMDRTSEFSVPDYHRDAWIPSEHTKNILLTIATSPAGASLPSRENLTMPGLMLQGDLSDSTKEAVIHFICSEQDNVARNVLTASDVTQDERGLRNLIQAGCYRAAINLTGRLLGIYGQGYGKMSHPSKHTPHSLQLWHTRLSLLAKLRQTDVLKAESESFGNLDKPDMFFSFHPELYGTRHGSMASFAFRLLLAEIPSYCDDPQQALDNLYKLLATVELILKNLANGLSEEGGTVKWSEVEKKGAIKLWSRRKSKISISIVNSALVARNFILATEVLEDLCQDPNWNSDQLEILRLALGRIHLFLGDVAASETKLVTKDFTKEKPTSREWINRGLMAVTQNAFQEGYDCFKVALSSDPSNVMLINNMAVCLLYMGKLKDAVQFLESYVTTNPAKTLQESLILNLSTLHELHTTHSRQPKLQLLRQINRYKGDAMDIQCLKLV